MVTWMAWPRGGFHSLYETMMIPGSAIIRKSEAIGWRPSLLGWRCLVAMGLEAIAIDHVFSTCFSSLNPPWQEMGLKESFWNRCYPPMRPETPRLRPWKLPRPQQQPETRVVNQFWIRFR